MQTNLFENTQIIRGYDTDFHVSDPGNIPIYLSENDDFLFIKKYREFHDNGQLWIEGYIAVLIENHKKEYPYLIDNKIYHGKKVVRIHILTKYFSNGQLAWQYDMGDGSFENSSRTLKKSVAYREDVSSIVSY